MMTSRTDAVSWLQLLPLCLYITTVSAKIAEKPTSKVALLGSDVTFLCATDNLGGNIRWSLYKDSNRGEEIDVYVNNKVKVATTKTNLTMYTVNWSNESIVKKGSLTPVRRYNLTISSVQKADAGLFKCFESSNQLPYGYAYLTVFDGKPQCTTDIAKEQGEYLLREGQLFVISCTLRYVGYWVPVVRCSVADIDVVLPVIESTQQGKVYVKQLSIKPTSSAEEKLIIKCEFYVNSTADEAKNVECPLQIPNCDLGSATLDSPWTSPSIRYVPISPVATLPPAVSASTVDIQQQAGKATAVTVTPRLTESVDSSGDAPEKRQDSFPTSTTGAALIAAVLVLIVVASIVAILLVTLLFHFKRRQNASETDNNRRSASTSHQPAIRTDNLLPPTPAISTMSNRSPGTHHYAEIMDPVLPNYAAKSEDVTVYDGATRSSSSNQLIVFDASAFVHKKPASLLAEGAEKVVCLRLTENQREIGLSGMALNRGDVQPVSLTRHTVVVRVPDGGGDVLVGTNPPTLGMPPIPDNDESTYVDGGIYEMVHSFVPPGRPHRKISTTYSSLSAPHDEGVNGRDTVRSWIPPPGGNDKSQPVATTTSLDVYTDHESVMSLQ